MKIVFNTDSLIMGGAEKLALQYVKFLAEHFEVLLLINEDNGLEGNALLGRIPCNVKYQYVVNKKIIEKINKYRKLKEKNIIYKLFYSYFLKKRRKSYKQNIRKILNKLDYDILIDFYCKVPADVVDKRTVSWLHSTLDNIKNKKELENKFKKIKKVIVITENMKSQFQSIFPEIRNIEMLYNPFNIREIQNLSYINDGITPTEIKIIKEGYILACSRLDKNKDLKTAIYAFNSLKNQIKEKFLIIGDGPEKANLIELVKELKLQDRILFLGTRQNPYLWMRNCKVFIHSSKQEGFGMVLVEALINECVILATDCPVGPREILDNGKYGILTPVGDVKKMEKNLLNCLNNTALRTELKNKAEERIKIFSEEEIYKQLMKIISVCE